MSSGNRTRRLVPSDVAGAPVPAELPLRAEWTMGFEKQHLGGSVHVLEAEAEQKRLFYSSGHIGVIFDRSTGRQFHLTGHTNRISSTCKSADDRFIFTADKGESHTSMIVWDASTGIPVRTYDNPHPHGVEFLALSHDGRTIATLSHEPFQREVQTLALWSWTDPHSSGKATLEVTLGASVGMQRFIAFNKHNNFELITNGDDSVVFVTWESGSLEYAVPANAATDFNTRPALYTVSEFLADTGDPITATVDGHVIQWAVPLPGEGEPPIEKVGGLLPRSAVKYMRLSDDAIYCLTLARDLIACAGEDGKVRFFDHSFRMVAWFEEIGLGPLTSIAFSRSMDLEYVPDGNSWTALRQFPFIVASRSGVIAEVDPKTFEELGAAEMEELAVQGPPPAKQAHAVLDGLTGAALCLSTHPFDDHFVVGAADGTLQLWNYADAADAASRREALTNDGSGEAVDAMTLPNASPVVLVSRRFDGGAITSVAFDSTGAFLCIGNSSGMVKFLHAGKLTDLPRCTFKHSRGAITSMRFSYDSLHLATGSDDLSVSLYSRKIDAQTGEALPQFNFVGKYRSHTERIVDVQFFESHEIIEASGEDSDQGSDPPPVQYRSKVNLMSVSEDRKIIQYDLDTSTPATGLHILTRSSHGQTAIPTATANFPCVHADFRARNVRSDENDDHHDSETGFFIFNDLFKVKQISTVTKRVTGTFNCPSTLQTPVREITMLPTYGDGKEYAVFRTDNRVGVLGLPFDGDDRRATLMIAHPEETTAVASSHDGKYVFTAGGADETVIAWKVHRDILEQIIPGTSYPGPGEKPLKKFPLIDQLEGGKDSPVYQELEWFFHFGQVEHEGERSANPHVIRKKVPIEQIPAILRSVGFYGTEQEMDDIVFEARHANFYYDSQLTDSVSFAELLRLFVNHHTIQPVSAADITKHFRTLALATNENETDDSKLDWAHFRELVEVCGEAMLPEEFDDCLESLLGDATSKIPEQLSARQFAQDLLGFEE